MIQQTCNGLAIWPMADNDSLTSLPRSVHGSNAFRAAHSHGWMWRTLDGESSDATLRTSKPNKPICWMRSGESLFGRHPHGQDLSWLPHACNAQGALPPGMRRCLETDPSKTPNSMCSTSSKVRASSSIGSQRQRDGIKKATEGKS